MFQITYHGPGYGHSVRLWAGRKIVCQVGGAIQDRMGAQADRDACNSVWRAADAVGWNVPAWVTGPDLNPGADPRAVAYAEQMA